MSLQADIDRVADAWKNGREVSTRAGPYTLWTDGVVIFFHDAPLLIRDLDPDHFLLRVPQKATRALTARLSAFIHGVAEPCLSGGYGVRVTWNRAAAAASNLPLAPGMLRLPPKALVRLPATLLRPNVQVLNAYVRKVHWPSMSSYAFMSHFAGEPRETILVDPADVTELHAVCEQFTKSPTVRTRGRWVSPLVAAFWHDAKCGVGTHRPPDTGVLRRLWWLASPRQRKKAYDAIVHPRRNSYSNPIGAWFSRRQGTSASDFRDQLMRIIEDDTCGSHGKRSSLMYFEMPSWAAMGLSPRDGK